MNQLKATCLSLYEISAVPITKDSTKSPELKKMNYAVDHHILISVLLAIKETTASLECLHDKAVVVLLHIGYIVTDLRIIVCVCKI